MKILQLQLHFKILLVLTDHYSLDSCTQLMAARGGMAAFRFTFFFKPSTNHSLQHQVLNICLNPKRNRSNFNLTRLPSLMGTKRNWEYK